MSRKSFFSKIKKLVIIHYTASLLFSLLENGVLIIHNLKTDSIKKFLTVWFPLYGMFVFFS